jgi:hypothetical protein
LLLLAGWFVAYFVMVYAIVRAACALGFGWVAGAALVCLVSLQPQGGEVFFNITNSHGMLGVALFLLGLVIPVEWNQGKWKILLLIPLLLSGPFSIVLCAVLFLRLALLKDWKTSSRFYIWVLAGASVQLICMVMSDRLTMGVIDGNLWHWVAAFLKLLQFGARGVWLRGTAWLFWGLALLCCLRAEPRKRIMALLLSLSAVWLLLLGLYACKTNPQVVDALGAASRYTWIPYALIFTAALGVSRGMRAHAVLWILVALLCYAGFQPVYSPNFQFASFVKFAAVKEVNVPVLAWPGYKTWHIQGATNAISDKVRMKELRLEPEHLSMSNLAVKEQQKEGLLLESGDVDPILIFDEPIVCGDRYSDVAIEVSMDRSIEGEMQMFWSEDGNFNEENSLRRWYPAGKVNAQFAFPAFAGGGQV